VKAPPLAGTLPTGAAAVVDTKMILLGVPPIVSRVAERLRWFMM
jgi:hypothetical protein